MSNSPHATLARRPGSELFRRSWLALLPLAAALAGCEEPQITHYKVPKPEAVYERNHARSRMLAAIVPHGPRAWFFKLTGPENAVARHAGEFNQLIGSLKLADGQAPAWRLPPGWREQPGSEMRYATLVVADEQTPLEVSVTMLGWSAADDTAQRLANVNRWREQMGLQPVQADELESHTSTIDVSGAAATMVDIVGTLNSGMPGPPMAAGNAPPAAAPIAPQAGPALPDFQVPAGWRPAENDALSMTAFQAGEGDAAVRVTVSVLSLRGADLLENVNRWRGQIGLGKITENELGQYVSTIKVENLDGVLVELDGPADAEPRRATVAAIVPHGPHAWFFKLTGRRAEVRAEQDRFRAFVESARFGAQKG